MKLKRFLSMFAVAIILISCAKEQTLTENTIEEPESKGEPEETTYFTFRSQEFEDTAETDNWIIVHDQNGNLLDYRTFERNSELVFKAIDTSLIEVKNLAVTMLTVRQIENISSHILRTFTDVPKEFVWSTGRDNVSSYDNGKPNLNKGVIPEKSSNLPTNKAGNYAMSVTNIPGILKYNITSPVSGVVTANYNPMDNDTLSLENINLREGVRYIFFIGDAEGGVKYKFFEVTEDVQNVTFDYDDFMNYETVLETTLADNNYLFTVSRGYENIADPGIGYEMTVELDFDNPSTSKIGYIPGYKSYSTSFHVTLNNKYAYRYDELSAEPLQAIDILEKPDFSVLDTTLNNFSFVTDTDFIRTRSTWRYEKNFPDASYINSSWKINTANKSAHKVGNLPEEIVIAYPKLNLEKLRYSSTILNIRGKSYEAVLNDLTHPSASDYPNISESIVIFAE